MDLLCGPLAAPRAPGSPCGLDPEGSRPQKPRRAACRLERVQKVEILLKVKDMPKLELIQWVG